MLTDVQIKTPSLVAASAEGHILNSTYSQSIMMSGHGQFHTDRDKQTASGFKPGTPYQTISINEIVAMVRNPASVPKERAQWVIPSSLLSRVYEEQLTDGRFFCLWADIDMPTHSIGRIFDMVYEAFRSDCIVYTSHSATEECQKCRIIIPLATPCSGVDFIRLQKHLNDRLEVLGILADRASERAAQLCYLPNRGAYYDYRIEMSAGPFVWGHILETVIESENAQANPRPLRHKNGNHEGLIDAFNRSHDLESLLERYGYRRHGDRWLSPNSQSGSPGVVLRDNRWISCHGSDAAIGRQYSGGASGDAFDLFAFYEHGGDKRSAFSAARRMLSTASITLVENVEQQDIARNSDCCDDFPMPLPLPDELLQVPEFDVNLLPDQIRPWVVDISERMQCPIDFLAVGAMVALSSVIGRRACVMPRRLDDWTVIPNLWGAVVGRPGVMKSPALAQVLRPLAALEAEAKHDYDEKKSEYERLVKLNNMAMRTAEKEAQRLIDQGQHEAAARVLVDGTYQTSAPPVMRRYRVTDATVEALGQILIENPNGLLAYRDELSGLISSMDREGQEGARAFYLQGYDGNQPYIFDRIGRGLDLRIPAVCISLLGGIQPSRLQAYISSAVNGGPGDDGLLQRFGLLTWPDLDSSWKNVDRLPDEVARENAYDVFRRLDRLEPNIDPATQICIPKTYRFSPAAQALFDEWRVGFEHDLRSSDRHPSLESHFAKYRKLVPSLALICALIDQEEAISAGCLERALGWASYLSSHAERVYTAGVRSQTRPAKLLLNKIRSGDQSDDFSARDVYRRCWAGLSNRAIVQQALDLLEELDYVFPEEHRGGPRGGRKQTRYRINPRVFE